MENFAYPFIEQMANIQFLTMQVCINTINLHQYLVVLYIKSDSGLDVTCWTSIYQQPITTL